MKKLLVAALAVVSVKIPTALAGVPLTQESDCIPRAQAAYVAATARDRGSKEQDLHHFVDHDHRQSAYRPIYKRIIKTVYFHPHLTPKSAYNGEYTKCLSEVIANEKRKKR